jgi:hypothetical protein
MWGVFEVACYLFFFIKDAIWGIWAWWCLTCWGILIGMRVFFHFAMCKDSIGARKRFFYVMFFSLFLEAFFWISMQVEIADADPNDVFCEERGFVYWMAHDWHVGCTAAISFYETALISHFVIYFYMTIIAWKHQHMGVNDPELQMKEKKRLEALEAEAKGIEEAKRAMIERGDYQKFN